MVICILFEVSQEVSIAVLSPLGVKDVILNTLWKERQCSQLSCNYCTVHFLQKLLSMDLNYLYKCG